MKNRFSIRETYHDYRLVDNVTGREACMGDGVDEPYDEIGTDLFHDRWEDDVNSAVAEVFEAYFPNLYNLVIYDNDNFIDRYTVILREASLLEKAVQKCEDLHHCLGLSIDPDSPQGFSQWGHADPKFMAERSERVHFLGLPENVQAHLAKRLEE